MFCDAYRKKVYGEKFQWLIVGMYESDWWRRVDPSLDCTADQVSSFDSTAEQVSSFDSTAEQVRSLRGER